MSEAVFVAHPNGEFYRLSDEQAIAERKKAGFQVVGTKRAEVEQFYRGLQAAGTDAPEAPSLDSLTVAELDAIAVERGVQFEDGMKKADKVAALERVPAGGRG